MKINLRRGLLRGWILLSCLWVALVLIFTVQDWNNYVSLRATAAKNHAEFDAFKTSQGPWEKHQSADKKDSGKRSLTAAESSELSQLRAKKSDHLELQWLEAENSAQLAKNELIGFLLVMLLPPPLILILGFAISWVISGFKIAT